MISTQQQAWFYDEHIISDIPAGKTFIDEFVQRLEGMGWTERDVFQIHLAVEEAMMNAIKHGNQNDRNKRLYIRCKSTHSEVRLEITDEGSGFRIEDIPNPTDDEQLELPSGRGLMLMRECMSTVQFNEPGNCVVMIKRRSTIV